MTIDKAKLKALAEAATPGPWKSCGTWVSGGIKANQFSVADCPRGDEQFIAAANPATVLELIAENALLHERDEEATQLCDALSVLLGEVAVAVRGPEKRKSRHGFHDIPSRVKTVVSERDQLKAENEGLRKIISEAANACGAAVSVGCSFEFMSMLPGEIASVIGKLRQECDARHPFRPTGDQPRIAYTGCAICGQFTDHQGLPCPHMGAFAMSKEASHD